jgi:hypothetical protein
MGTGLKDYVRAAFSARPAGMLVPPNWIGIGVFALLGVVNPGFWVLGAGAELAYLYAMSTNRRFQRIIDGKHAIAAGQASRLRLTQLVFSLSRDDQERYRAMERRCQAILELQRGAEISSGVKAQSEGLARLLWIFLSLMLTRQSINRVLRETGGDDPLEKALRVPRAAGDRSLEERLAQQEETLKKADLGEELRKSIAGQVEILRQRIEKRREAREKIAFLEAEVARIEQQADLLREQAVLVTDPEAVSQRIDQIAATLGGTSQWIREQQQIYGQVEDMLAETPPVTLEVSEKESS